MSTFILRSSCWLFLVFFPQILLKAQAPNRTEDTTAARQWLQRGEVELAKENFQEALDAVEKAQALYVRQEMWEEATESATLLSVYADNVSDEVKARYAQSALDLASLHLSPNHLLFASAYRQKAEALILAKSLDSANYFLKLASPIFKHQEDWANLAWSEILLSVNFLNQAAIDSCDFSLQKVERLLSNNLVPQDHREDVRATHLYLAGMVYDRQGDIDRAIDNTKQAIAIDLNKAKLTKLDSSFLSNHYNNLGSYYTLKGDFPQALDYLMQALYSYSEAQRDPHLLNNIGQLWQRKGNNEEARQYFQRSLNSTQGKANQLQAQIDALNGLTLTSRELNLDDQALAYIQQTIDLPSNYRKFIAWALKGTLLTKRQQITSALACFNASEKAFKKDSTDLDGDPFSLSKIAYLKGKAYTSISEYHEAIRYYQLALVTCHSTFRDSLTFLTNPSLKGVLEPFYFFSALHAKAKTLATISDQQEKALQTYQLTIQWIDTLRTNYSSEAAQLDWSDDFKPIYQEAIAVAYQLYQNHRDNQYLDLAFTFSEKSKNAILLETLKTKEGQLLAGVPDSLLQKEKALNLDIAFYEKTLQNAKAEKNTSKETLFQKYLSQSRLELIDLKKHLETHYPKFQEWKYEQQQSIASVQAQLLDPQSAFLEYAVGDSSAFVFVITKKSAQLFRLDSPEQINSSFATFRSVLLDPSAFQQNAKTALHNYQQKAQELYQAVLAKALETLDSDIQQLIIIPDGVLNALPFEALVSPNKRSGTFDFAQLNYLLYDFQIHYAYSAKLLLKNQNRSSQLEPNTSCLAFAPSYQSTETIALRGDLEQLRASGQLQGTAKEVQQIAQYVKGQFDFGKSATEQAFKSQAAQFGLLHLAMHGVLDLENANFNHLQFSDLNPSATEDNLLHHYEIANMDLSAQLVVLSACETGLGKYEKGEGVYSLARSFMYAGVPSVVMSLWKVSDASTSQLMPLFYQSLTGGASKVEALQKAKLQFLNEVNVEYRHPFYWSAFVVMGDAQALQTSGLAWWKWGALALLLFLILAFLRKRSQKSKYRITI